MWRHPGPSYYIEGQECVGSAWMIYHCHCLGHLLGMEERPLLKRSLLGVCSHQLRCHLPPLHPPVSLLPGPLVGMQRLSHDMQLQMVPLPNFGSLQAFVYSQAHG